MTSRASTLGMLPGSIQQKMTPLIDADVTMITSSIPTSNGTITSNIWTDDISAKSAITVDGTLEVQGRDVLSELDEMRDALMLIKRDVDMEAKYPKLKELKDAYAAQLAKYKTFDAIKDSK